jgi:hypothetical protein
VGTNNQHQQQQQQQQQQPVRCTPHAPASRLAVATNSTSTTTTCSSTGSLVITTSRSSSNVVFPGGVPSEPPSAPGIILHNMPYAAPSFSCSRDSAGSQVLQPGVMRLAFMICHSRIAID